MWHFTQGEVIATTAASRFSFSSGERGVAEPEVAEAAVVSRPDDLVGEAIVAFVTLKSEFVGDDETVALLDDLKARGEAALSGCHHLVEKGSVERKERGPLFCPRSVVTV